MNDQGTGRGDQALAPGDSGYGWNFGLLIEVTFLKLLCPLILI